MLPKISFLARTTRDTELIYTASGTALCKVGLACSEKYGEKETQLFIDAVAFGKTGEMINNVQKGQRVFVHGKIQTEQWQDRQGQKRSKISLVIESFEFIEKKEGGISNYSENPNSSKGSYQAQHNAPKSQSQDIPDIDIVEDEIPF